MAVDARFIKGLELFKRREFFECHEVIEDLWLETPESDSNRDLYKGVIQAAAAIYQFERGILSGALGLYLSSVGYLEIYQPVSLGINITRLIKQIKVCFESLESWNREEKLSLNKRLIPKIDHHLNCFGNSLRYKK